MSNVRYFYVNAQSDKGFLTLNVDLISDISPVCFWQKDFYQKEYIDNSGGPNLVSLRETRENFKFFGQLS